MRMLLFLIFLSLTIAQSSIGLFFSRYYIGYGDIDGNLKTDPCSNRFIEIYNPTSTTYFLDDYSISFAVTSNDLTNNADYSLSFSQSMLANDATIGPGETWLIIDDASVFNSHEFDFEQTDGFYDELSNSTLVGLVYHDTELIDVIGFESSHSKPRGWTSEHIFIIRKGWGAEEERSFKNSDWHYRNASARTCDSGKNDISDVFNPNERHPSTSPTVTPSTSPSNATVSNTPSKSPSEASSKQGGALKKEDLWFYACLILLGVILGTCGFFCLMSCCRSKDEYGFYSASLIEKQDSNHIQNRQMNYNLAVQDGELVYASIRSSGLGDTPADKPLSPSRQEGERKESIPTGYSVVNANQAVEASLESIPDEDNRISAQNLKKFSINS